MSAIKRSKQRKAAKRRMANAMKKMSEIYVLCGVESFLVTKPILWASHRFPDVHAWSPATENVHSLIEQYRRAAKVHENVSDFGRRTLPSTIKEGTALDNVDGDSSATESDEDIIGCKQGEEEDDGDGYQESQQKNSSEEEKSTMDAGGVDRLNKFFELITGKDMMDMDSVELKKAMELIMKLQSRCKEELDSRFY